MQTRTNYLLTVVLSLLTILLTSCGDENVPDTMVDKTNTDHLIDGRWYLESSNDPSVDEIGSEWYFDFASDNAWSGKTPSDTGLADASGTWEFNADETQLIVSEDVDINALTIITLNESIFTFTVVMNGETISLTFDHVQ